MLSKGWTPTLAHWTLHQKFRYPSAIAAEAPYREGWVQETPAGRAMSCNCLICAVWSFCSAMRDRCVFWVHLVYSVTPCSVMCFFLTIRHMRADLQCTFRRTKLFVMSFEMLSSGILNCGYCNHGYMVIYFISDIFKNSCVIRILSNNLSSNRLSLWGMQDGPFYRLEII